MNNKKIKLSKEEKIEINKLLSEEPLEKKVIVNQEGIVLLQDTIGRIYSVERSLYDGTLYFKWLDKKTA